MPHSGTCTCADCRDIDDAADILANQPAAPARTEDIGEHPSEPSYEALRDQVEYWREQATHTEAEQAVLDACSGLNIRRYSDGAFHKPEYGEVCGVLAAELARRGLKP